MPTTSNCSHRGSKKLRERRRPAAKPDLSGASRTSRLACRRFSALAAAQHEIKSSWKHPCRRSIEERRMRLRNMEPAVKHTRPPALAASNDAEDAPGVGEATPTG